MFDYLDTVFNKFCHFEQSHRGAARNLIRAFDNQILHRATSAAFRMTENLLNTVLNPMRFLKPHRIFIVGFLSINPPTDTTNVPLARSIRASASPSN